MRKRLGLLLVSSSLLVACTGQDLPQEAPPTQAGGDAVLVLGDDEVTKDMFYDEMKNNAGVATAQGFIIKHVLEDYLEDTHLLFAEAEADVAEQIDQVGGRDRFLELLQFQNLGSIEAFTDQVYLSKLTDAVMEAELDPTDEELEAYYDSLWLPSMEAKHILVEDKEVAEDLIKQLQDGADFGELAGEYSTDTSGGNGGLLEPFVEGQMVQPFEDAVMAADNESLVEEPIESEFGYHVIYVIQNGNKGEWSDEIKDQVRDDYIRQMANDSGQTYQIIGELVRDANIEIKDADLQAALDNLVSLADYNNQTLEEPATEE